MNFFHWFVLNGIWYLVCEQDKCTYLYNVQICNIGQKIWDHKKIGCKCNQCSCNLHANKCNLLTIGYNNIFSNTIIKYIINNIINNFKYNYKILITICNYLSMLSPHSCICHDATDASACECTLCHIMWGQLRST